MVGSSKEEGLVRYLARLANNVRRTRDCEAEPTTMRAIRDIWPTAWPSEEQEEGTEQNNHVMKEMESSMIRLVQASRAAV